MESRSRRNTNDSISYSKLKSHPDPAKLQFENVPRFSINDIDNSSINSVSSESHNQSNEFFSKVTGLISRKFSSSSQYSSTDSLTNILNHSQLHTPPNHSPLQSPLQTPRSIVKETNHISLEYDPINKRRVLNTYEILKELGRGQHGKVKLARDLLSNELVAIKIIDRQNKPKLGSNFQNKPNLNELKIKKEISIMKNCNHKNVVKLIEVLDDLKSRKIYLVLEYLEKGEIKWSEDNKPLLTFQQTRSIFRDVLLGLEYLHFQGIVHRDIKPANLLVSKDNIVKISDFGVSFTNFFDNEKNDLDLAKTAGTPAFFAPELCQTNFFDEFHQAKQSKYKITHKIDIWALGITLYCLLFGKVPFDADSEFELFNVIVNQKLEFPSKESLPFKVANQEYEACKDLLCKLLTKNPDDRIDIPEIKDHEFVTWQMSELDRKFFCNENREYSNRKIVVNNDDLNHGVLGIGNKLKRSIVKALHSKKKVPTTTAEEVIDHRNKGTNRNSSSSSSSSISKNSNTVNTITSNISMSNNSVKSNSIPTSLSNTNMLHSLILSESMNTPSSQMSPTITRPSTPSISMEPTMDYNKISRSSGEALLIETRRNVSGDLYIQNQSAKQAFKDLITKNEKRRSSNSTVNSDGSNMNPYYPNTTHLQTKTQSSPINFFKKTNSNISLPINESFASLDSFSEEYLKFKCNELNQQNDVSNDLKKYDLDSHMKKESVNIKICDEAIEPIQKVTSIKTPRNSIMQPNYHFSSASSCSSHSSDGSSHDSSSQEESDEENDKELTLQFGPKRDTPKSPPYLRKRVMSHESKLSRDLQHIKYNNLDSFQLENSMELPLNLQGEIPEYIDVPDSLIFGSSTPVTSARRPSLTAPSSTSRIEQFPDNNSSNTSNATIVPSPEPVKRSSSSAGSSTVSKELDTPIAKFHKKIADERIPSPLSQNAPKSSKATINSHLINSTLSPGEKHKFNNHYKKDPIISPFPNSHHLNDNQSVFKQNDAKNNHHHRSSSVTVGLLQFEGDKEKSENS